MPLTIITHSDKSGSKKLTKEGLYYFSYHLPETLYFKEPHYARLVHVIGPSTSTHLVYADFVTNQVVNGELVPYLGCSSSSAPRSWIPLRSNHLASSGHFILQRFDRTPLSSNAGCRVIVEIASKTELENGGAQSENYF